MTVSKHRFTASRRTLLRHASALVLVPWLPARAADDPLPPIPALAALLGGRTPRFERLRMQVPPLADNGQAVPLKLVLSGPFNGGPSVEALHLFSERNPVPDMVTFRFPQGLERVEIDTRVRLAGTQRLVAVAAMSDSTLYASVAEVVVTLAACLDGS
jgi:sulfur-oxidizing protein SoxY